MMQTAIERFEERYLPEPNSGCWNWTACTSESGYGKFHFEGKTIRAHRFSYENYVGPIGDLYVLHKCDNKVCVNPDHLFLGTHADNMADRNEKGRQAKGSTHGQAKLTEADILAIRADGRYLKEIAADYGVSFSQIGKIKSRKKWAHFG